MRLDPGRILPGKVDGAEVRDASSVSPDGLMRGRTRVSNISRLYTHDNRRGAEDACAKEGPGEHEVLASRVQGPGARLNTKHRLALGAQDVTLSSTCLSSVSMHGVRMPPRH